MCQYVVFQIMGKTSINWLVLAFALPASCLQCPSHWCWTYQPKPTKTCWNKYKQNQTKSTKINQNQTKLTEPTQTKIALPACCLQMSIPLMLDLPTKTKQNLLEHEQTKPNKINQNQPKPTKTNINIQNQVKPNYIIA